MLCNPCYVAKSIELDLTTYSYRSFSLSLSLPLSLRERGLIIITHKLPKRKKKYISKKSSKREKKIKKYSPSMKMKNVSFEQTLIGN